MSDLISVIVPVYNAEKYLDSCVKSIVNQSYRELEIILVDDGSTDGSSRICDEWKLKDQRIVALHKQNGGVSSARNEGIKKASGAFISFVDADDLLDSFALERLEELSKTFEGSAFLCAFDRFFEEEELDDNTAIESNAKVLQCGGLKGMISCRQGCFCVGMLISRSIVVKNNILFDEGLTNLEDVAWTGKLLNHLKRFVYTPVPYYHYRVTPGSITSRCADPIWQAECWAKVYRSIMEKPANYQKNKSEMLRHCLKNFFAESFAAKIGYSKTNEILKCSRGKFLVYRMGIWLKNKL
ncbi:MAG: glycosyltransferase [Lachnospiraceae bacterium]|nr:glycosyltransferase [Lachnospiraceae bacterium]